MPPTGADPSPGYLRTRMGLDGDAPRLFVGGSPLSGGKVRGTGGTGAVAPRAGGGAGAGGECVVAGRRAGTGVPGWGFGLRHLHTVTPR
jgi:hypothetical protein